MTGMRVCTPRPPAACTSWASRRRRADRVRTGEPANRRSPEPRRGLAGGWRWGTLSAAEPDAGNPRGGGDLPPSWRTKLSEWQDARRLGHWEQSAVATWSNEMTPELLTSMRELDSRQTDGMRVRLLWCEGDGECSWPSTTITLARRSRSRFGRADGRSRSSITPMSTRPWKGRDDRDRLRHCLLRV